MKLQKTIIITCSIMIIIIGIMIYYFGSTTKKYDISVGILTGTFITILTSTVFYNYEKNKILNRIYTKYSDIYFALINLDKYLGEFLVSKEITDSKFGMIYMLTREIGNIAYSFDVEEYSSFFAKNIDNIINNLNNFKTKLSNLSQITANRSKDILEYEILQKDIEYKRMQGLNEQTLLPSIQLKIEHRDSILILVAKLHEYSVSLKLELDDLLISLDKAYKFKSKWTARKEYFKIQVNNLDNLNQTKGK